jgi:hypothetical protein
MKNLLPVIVVIALFASGCYYESEEHLFPSANNSCDTINVTYSASIVPLLNICFQCHANNTSSFGGGFNFQDTVILRSQINSGQIYRSITFQSHPMPPNGQLSNCNILIFKKWIDHGAPFK